MSLLAAFGAERLRAGVPLAAYSTFRTGGPAEWFLETRSADELVQAVRLARDEGLPVTLIGGGSNVLIGDRGIRGLVVRARATGVEMRGTDAVRAESGAAVNGLVRWTIHRGLAGFEAWAGTPGTLGGALFGNAHYGGRLIGDTVREASLLGRDGTVAIVPGHAMEFGYDWSRLQRTGEFLLWAVCNVEPGHDPAALREVARRSLAHRKRTQPLDAASAGCVFQNPDPARDAVPDGIPPSAGALVDRAGLKGHAIGRARVSTVHANFVVNEGGASSADIRALVDLCRREVRARFGVDLRDEIQYLGDF